MELTCQYGRGAEEMTDPLIWIAYLLGSFKIVRWVERWPDGFWWAQLGFLTLFLYLTILSGVAFTLYS